MSVPGQQKTVRFDNLSVNGVGMARRKVAPYARLRGSTELAEVRSATPRRVGPQLLSGVALAETDAEAIGINAPYSLTHYAFCVAVFLGVFLATGTVTVWGDTHYVAHGGQTPMSNYTSWATAASNIQDAVDAAGASDTVSVSNGVYDAGGGGCRQPD